MAQSVLSSSLLFCLANKVLASVLLEMPTLETLQNLLTAYPFSLSFFLGAVIPKAGSFQLQKLVGTVLAVRNRPGLGGIEEQDEYLKRLLTDKSKPSLSEAITNPTLALHDILSVILDIEYFERSFVAS